MSEPDVASSDPTNLQTRVVQQGDAWVINGRKWFTTGAANPDCKLLIVMCRSGTDEAGKHAQHSMLLVPLDTPGVTVVRNIPIMQHHSPEGHCEIVFRDVHLPLDHLLGKPGEGFAMAQARLGPGRIHHCMRTIGQCELALSMMCERTLEREAFGKHLSDFANVQEWIAESRLEIDQARLLVLRAAWQLDQGPSAQSRVDVSAIKVVAARLQTRVVNRAIQVFGAMGLSNDTPLAYFWTWGRAMQLLDGPDEVHLRSVARHELSQARQQLGASAAYFTLPEQLLAEPRIR
jgi:acyl-CoA dehydrogenase